MGSASSTQIHTINESTRSRSLEDRPDDSTFSVKNKKEAKNSPSLLKKNPQMAHSVDNIQQLEKMLSESESRRLDLEDHVESLEETVRDLTADTESTIGPDTMHVKQEQIAQLELTCKTLQEEISQLKVKHKRRIKKLNAQLTEVKQESSILHLELKAEQEKLLEENIQLKQKLYTYEKDGTVQSDGHPRMDLIVELSGQVSEQSEEIERLEGVIDEKDRMIESLEQTQTSKTVTNRQTSGSDAIKRQTESSHTATDRQIQANHTIRNGQRSATESCQAAGAGRLVSQNTHSISSSCEDDYTFSEPVEEKYSDRWQSSNEWNEDEKKSGRMKEKKVEKINILGTGISEGMDDYTFPDPVQPRRWQSSNEQNDSGKSSKRKSEKRNEVEKNISRYEDDYSYTEPVFEKKESRWQYGNERNDSERQHERKKNKEMSISQSNGVRLVGTNGKKENNGFPLHQFLSDSDSDVSVDSEFSLTKVHSAPPGYGGSQHGGASDQTTRRRRAREGRDEPQTVLVPVKCFEENDLFRISDELGSVLTSNVQPIT